MNRDDCLATVEFLISQELKYEVFPFEEDTNDWLRNMTYKIRLYSARKRIEENHINRRYSFEEELLKFAQFFKSSIGIPSVKTKLEMLMRSNIVRLTDKRYMLKLMSKIKENHEKQQQARIEERKKQELMRTKNMILHRLIPVQEAPPEIHQYPLFQLYLYCDSLIEKRRIMRAPKKVKMRNSLYRFLYPEQKEEEVVKDDDDEEIYMKKIYVGDKEKLVPLSNIEIEKMLQEQESVKDIQDGYMLSQEDYNRLHYESDAVKNLKDVQTVEELYTKAYEIVGILYTHMDKELKTKPPEETVQTTEELTPDVITEPQENNDQT